METLQEVQRWLADHPAAGSVVGLTTLVLVAWLADRVAVRYLLMLVRRVVARTRATWDDALVEERIPERLSHVVPALVLYLGIPLVPGLSEDQVQLFHNALGAVVILLLAMAVAGVLSGVNAVYSRTEGAAERPIKGYVQLVQIAVYIVAVILIISTLTGQNPGVLLGGIGAFTAVLLLVFRDTILSLVASVQLTSNDMVRIGDWIEMPKYGADGDVIEIALHTVKVQNWDKTITTIPTHKLIEDSFRNWRGMSLSGGRRIKRALNLDMNSVRFLSPDEVEEFGRRELLAEYIADKRAELARWEEERQAARAGAPDAEEIRPESRRLTNLGTFRAYVLRYLRSHPLIHQGLTLLVRQLPPGPHGIPLEVYTFSADTRWAHYEALQADLFDHLLAVLPEFGLRVYQSPSGKDLEEGLLKAAALKGEVSP